MRAAAEWEALEAERAQRVRMVAEVAEHLRGGKQASAGALLFMGEALARRLTEEGCNDLEAVLRIRPPRGSKRTPRQLLIASSSR